MARETSTYAAPRSLVPSMAAAETTVAGRGTATTHYFNTYTRPLLACASFGRASLAIRIRTHLMMGSVFVTGITRAYVRTCM